MLPTLDMRPERSHCPTWQRHLVLEHRCEAGHQQALGSQPWPWSPWPAKCDLNVLYQLRQQQQQLSSLHASCREDFAQVLIMLLYSVTSLTLDAGASMHAVAYVHTCFVYGCTDCATALLVYASSGYPASFHQLTSQCR